MTKIRHNIKWNLKRRDLFRLMSRSEVTPSLILDIIMAVGILTFFHSEYNPVKKFSNYKERAKLTEAYVLGKSVQMEIDDFLAEKNEWPSEEYIQRIFNVKDQNWHYIQAVQMDIMGFTLILEKGLAGLENPKLSYRAIAVNDPAFPGVKWDCGYSGAENNNQTNLPKNILVEGCL